MLEKLKNFFFIFFEGDEMVWVYEINGYFFVKFMCRIMMILRFINLVNIVKGVWKGFVLFKVEIFGWIVLFGRLNIKGRLM